MHRRPNLLILDEPTNHLDIDSREALEEALEEFPGTVLAVSHDRYFINRLFQKIWTIENSRFGVFAGNYEYYKEKLAEKMTTAPAAPEPNKKPGRLAEAPAGKSQRSSQIRSQSSWEKDIAEAEKELEAVDAEMLDPQISTDAAGLAALLGKRDEIQRKLDELYAAWMNAAE